MIFGFSSSKYGSIYNIITDNTRSYIWKANVIAELKDESILISFNWNDDLYELKLSMLKENYFTGKIYWEKEEYGNAFLWKYSRDNEILIKGDFVEDDSGNYECIIELRSIK